MRSSLVNATPAPVGFELRLPPLALEGGGTVGGSGAHVLRGVLWGPEADLPALAARARLLHASEPHGAEQGPISRAMHARAVPASPANAPNLEDTVPTVLCIHALTGDARVGGPGGWWEPLVGPGRTLDPNHARVLCFNNLGSCYGSSGPGDTDFPSWEMQGASTFVTAAALSGRRVDPRRWPATLTSWDLARSILLALDALGVERVALATGGSLGGMVALCLAALDPARFERIAPIAATESASAWLIGYNHVARQALLLEPDFPECDGRGLELARQIALLTYRAEPGLHERQGRAQGGEEAAWSPARSYRMQTYLEHQGRKLRRRFDGRAYLTQIDAMDHHDLARPPPGFQQLGSEGFGLPRIRASLLVASIDSDQLYFPAQSKRLARGLREHGRLVEEVELKSDHGHDAFLIEWEQLDRALRRALDLPAFGAPR
jgi:homoserine O-acetyltransferase/O-succinyltransferase